jgi:hypothetical protein
MMDSDKPTASGKLNRDINRPIYSPRHEFQHIGAQSDIEKYRPTLRRAANWR